MQTDKRGLTSAQQEQLLHTLQARFETNMDRHPKLAWANVQAKLEQHTEKLWSLYEMERTGGEPDVVAYDAAADAYIFYDCVAESPKGRRSICYDGEFPARIHMGFRCTRRRSICYDGEARRGRKKNPPADSALEMARSMGIDILTEEEYRALQLVEPFDTTTSSWIQTPPAIRERGGALFGDHRYGHVFIYHNGADSYYAARGFRGLIRV
mgnify:CR=1 FL=1